MPHSPQYAWRETKRQPLYEFETHVEIEAICTYPDERAGDAYELTMYSEDDPESEIYWKLGDVQVVDEHRVPQYRKYRGKQIPVYAPPRGMGTLDKVRGERRWRAAIWVRPRFTNDVLVLLGHGKQLYLSIHERKLERQRWVQGITVQTTDPAEE